MDELIKQLERLGVPVQTGKPLDVQVQAYDLDELKGLLDIGLTPEARQEHHRGLFDGIDRTADLDAQLLGRVEEFVFGNGELSDDDRTQAELAFPLKVNVLMDPGPATVDTAKDLSTSDGSISRVAYTDLTLAQGGSFSCSATPLVFSCTSLTRTGNTGNPALADFNILGKVGHTPDPPATPGAATQATTGPAGQCSSAGISGPGGQNGTEGKEGTEGTAADDGGAGTPSQLATITISDTLTASQLTVFTQSGAGGKGATGGKGGTGQQGGDGGTGVTCGCTGNGGGSGASGGRGGKGGRGGNGGPGANAAANITVRVPSQADISKIVGLPKDAPPGEGGNVGPGGDGGAKGVGGGAGKDNKAGGNGGDGGVGPAGDRGTASTVIGKPAQVLPQVY